MPVNSTHPSYEAQLPSWTRIRDAVAGQAAVKAKTTQYLPKLQEQDPQEYEAYLGRALFYGASGRTVMGLVGAIMRKPPVIEFPDEDFLKTIGRQKEPLTELIRVELEQVVGPGRYGVLVDAPDNVENGEPFLACYTAECIINWLAVIVEDKVLPVEIVLAEQHETRAADDQYKTEVEARWRVLRLEAGSDGSPVYVQEVWAQAKEADAAGKRDFVRLSRTTPTMKGGLTWDVIPFVVFNPTNLALAPQDSVISALVDVNFSHYNNSADLEHGRHFTALPTPYAAGFDVKGKMRVGSELMYMSTDPLAKIAFAEFTGAGLNHLKEGMTEKKAEMATLGARLLEEQKRDAEAAETVRLRQAGEESALSSISNTSSLGWTQVLQFVARWRGMKREAAEKAVTCQLNRDFNVVGLDPAMLAQLMLQVQGGLMSWDTYFYNLKKGETYPDDRTMEDEARLIKAGPPLGIEDDTEQEPQEEGEGEEDGPDGEEEPQPAPNRSGGGPRGVPGKAR